jgi:hypothetical protein
MWAEQRAMRARDVQDYIHVLSRLGLFNRRGVKIRMPTDGGGQKRDEAARYRGDAKASALLWPRTHGVGADCRWI